ncbi:hypothetical protein EDB81DRAFT_661137 [Dactylonectria macrodidyma]|uniref:Rhodopsin domain-containing protein n=1 Tax=Dactylonectria macrodidyma TaxID=307937 RepID=A0A9P9IRU1_9HYPO|nr:hypothetical protein EDB81DRAFT_661137 [Dactylonectria macrodidyma]
MARSQRQLWFGPFLRQQSPSCSSHTDAEKGVSFGLLGISVGLVAARLYLRLGIQNRRLLVSDLLMVTTLLMGIPPTVLLIYLDRLGALDPAVKITFENFRGSPDDIAQIIKLFWIGAIPFITTLYLCKATLLSTYLQVFPIFMHKRRIFLWAIVAYTIMAYALAMGLTFGRCTPIEDNWYHRALASTCRIKRGKYSFMINWSLHFFGDLLVFALPWLIVPHLQLRRTLKIGIYCTFLLGLFDICFAILRFVSLVRASIDSSLPIGLTVLWTSLEANVGIVVACLPSLRPYFSKDYGGYGQRSSSSYPETVGQSGARLGKRSASGVGRNGINAIDEAVLYMSDGERRSITNGSELELVPTKK